MSSAATTVILMGAASNNAARERREDKADCMLDYSAHANCESVCLDKEHSSSSPINLFLEEHTYTKVNSCLGTTHSVETLTEPTWFALLLFVGVLGAGIFKLFDSI